MYTGTGDTRSSFVSNIKRLHGHWWYFPVMLETALPVARSLLQVARQTLFVVTTREAALRYRSDLPVSLDSALAQRWRSSEKIALKLYRTHAHCTSTCSRTGRFCRAPCRTPRASLSSKNIPATNDFVEPHLCFCTRNGDAVDVVIPKAWVALAILSLMGTGSGQWDVFTIRF